MVSVWAKDMALHDEAQQCADLVLVDMVHVSGQEFDGKVGQVGGSKGIAFPN